jgi:hypothetical protein
MHCKPLSPGRGAGVRDLRQLPFEWLEATFSAPRYAVGLLSGAGDRRKYDP